MKNALGVLAIATLTAACGFLPGGSRSPEPSSGSGAADGGSGESAGPPPLFGGSAAQIPEAYAPLKFGTTKEEAKAADERFVGGGGIGEERYPGVSFFVSWDEDVLGHFWLSFDDVVAKTVVPDATKAWGEPVQGKYLDHDLFLWFNDETGTRAFFYATQLEVQRYVTYAELFKSDEEPFFTEVIGKTKDELKKLDLHPSAEWEEENLDLWPTKLGDNASFTRIHFQFDKKDKVESYYYTVDLGNYRDQKDAVLKVIRDRYGEGKRVKDDREKYQLTEKAPIIRAEFSDISHNWQVSVNWDI